MRRLLVGKACESTSPYGKRWEDICSLHECLLKGENSGGGLNNKVYKKTCFLGSSYHLFIIVQWTMGQCGQSGKDHDVHFHSLTLTWA